MSSLPPLSPSARRQSTISIAEEDEDGLTQSLSQLSLTKNSTSEKLPAARTATGHLPSPTGRSASLASQCPRSFSRTSSHGRDLRPNGADAPVLLRKASMNSLHSANGAASSRVVSRRSSSAHLLSPKSRDATSRLFGDDHKPPVTASSIACDSLKAELEQHHLEASACPTKAVVVLNDAVYGHRYSRPRTSRNVLSTIVERPERIKAAILGVSAAYVRLGGRHSGGKLPIDVDRDVCPLPSIPFRILRTGRQLRLTSQAVTNVHGTKWMEELKQMCDLAESKLALGGKELQRSSVDRDPNERPPQKLHEGDLYLCSESLQAIEGALGAVCEAVDAVFTSTIARAFVGARPPGHHCSASHPSGFCWVNNVHVGIMHAALSHGLTHAAIIDFDLHHGDGSQAIAWGHNTRASTASKNAATWKKTSIGYFSLHDINSYPCEMGNEEKVKNASLCIESAHGQTIWNVHLQQWENEEDFEQIYESSYSVILQKTRRYLKDQALRLKNLRQTPKAAIFFSAGFDASEWEGAGMQRHQVNVPTSFYARITRDVVALAAEEDLSVGGRVISVLEGGYSDRALYSGILSHLSGLVGEQTQSERPLSQPEHLNAGDVESMNFSLSASKTTNDQDQTPMSKYEYDPSWWTSDELDKLDTIPEVASPTRKACTATPPTYCSPTQASTARVVDPENMRQSLSSLSVARTFDRSAPVPPSPIDISWSVAAQELAKLLIPSHRQTDSCTAEDLNAEATRLRRDRQSSRMGVPPPVEPISRPTSRMALRERKARTAEALEKGSSEQQAKPRRKALLTPEISPKKVIDGAKSAKANVLSKGRRASRRLSGTLMAPSPAEAVAPSGASGRPSSASSKTPSGGGGKLTVKKTRAVPADHEESMPKMDSDSPTKPKVSSENGTPAAPSHGLKATEMEEPAIARAGALMNVTKGVKKIKINLTAKSQRDARDQSDAGAVGAGADAPIAPVYIPAAVTSLQQEDEKADISIEASTPSFHSDAENLGPQSCPSFPPQPSSLLGMSGLGSVLGASESPASTANTTPIAVTLPRAAPSNPQPVSGPSGGADAFFIPYQPEGPAPKSISPNQPLQWLPANLTTTPRADSLRVVPNSAQKQSKLFHYTSAGIPFAPRAQSRTLGSQAMADDDDAARKTEDNYDEPPLSGEPFATPQKQNRLT